MDNHNPIRVGIVGCGQMGSGLAHTINNIHGMQVSAIADIEPQRGISTLMAMGRSKEDIVVTDTKSSAEDALRNAKAVVTQDALLMTRIDALEANVEATGNTEIGAKVAYNSIMEKKPIIMLNVETDITVGTYLNNLARKSGALYTVASGDEPGVCKMLYEQAMLMGFEVVCLGKGKNNPINYQATPQSCEQEALSKDMNPKMLASFVDGTKTMVEMAAVANATGLLPDVAGMHGPRVELDELVEVFKPKADGGIFDRRGTVDYSTGAIAPGVFAIVYSDDPRIRKDMKFITRAEGPYYLHFRPYHLCDLETPQSVAEAVLLGEVTVTAQKQYAEVVCKSKRTIQTGEKVGGIGGSDWHGHIMTHEEALQHKALSIGIGMGAVATRTIEQGELLSYNNCRPDESSFVYTLRKMQDSLY
jgi:predicted homoserine dehydrogenase-like protein